MRFAIIVLWLLLGAAALAAAQVSLSFGMPGLSIGINVPVYPQLVRVPGYPVYYAPGLQSNFFFCDGLYWVYQDDDWYASDWYDGPWGRVSPGASTGATTGKGSAGAGTAGTAGRCPRRRPCPTTSAPMPPSATRDPISSATCASATTTTSRAKPCRASTCRFNAQNPPLRGSGRTSLLTIGPMHGRCRRQNAGMTAGRIGRPNRRARGSSSRRPDRNWASLGRAARSTGKGGTTPMSATTIAGSEAPSWPCDGQGRSSLTPMSPLSRTPGLAGPSVFCTPIRRDAHGAVDGRAAAAR